VTQDTSAIEVPISRPVAKQRGLISHELKLGVLPCSFDALPSAPAVGFDGAKRRQRSSRWIPPDRGRLPGLHYPHPPARGLYLLAAKSELGAKGKAAEAVELRMGGRASYHFAPQGISGGARARSSANFVAEAERELERQWHLCGVVLGPRDGWKAGRLERTETGKQAPDRLSPLLIACW
jgi:hypothetical protein